MGDAAMSCKKGKGEGKGKQGEYECAKCGAVAKKKDKVCKPKKIKS